MQHCEAILKALQGNGMQFELWVPTKHDHIARVILRPLDGYTATSAWGRWRSPDGDYVEEPVTIYTVIATGGRSALGKVHRILKQVRAELLEQGERSVLITGLPLTATF